jgi:hypothetical protein
MKFFCTDSSKYVVLFCFKFSSLSGALMTICFKSSTEFEQYEFLFFEIFIHAAALRA